MQVLIDSDLKDELKRSKKLVGELYPVLKSQDGRILAGNHRSAAGWQTVKVVPVKDELDFLMKQQAAMIQHRNSPQDHIGILRAMCEYVEKNLAVPKQKIGKYVVEHCSALKRSYAYELIPNEYKGRPRGVPVSPLSDKSSRKEVQKIGRTTFRVKPSQNSSVANVSSSGRQVCPTCHGSGYID